MKILFAASEALPLIKTGGLADVAGSLPRALQAQGLDVRLVLPAYRGVADQFPSLEPLGVLTVPDVVEPVRLRVGRLGAEEPQVILVDAPALYDRPGGPYGDESGKDHADNALRFATFARVVVALALGQGNDGWRPDLVHCNDWQTGLVPALLAREWNRPATLFTIHNLAYQGLFDYAAFADLDLPSELWSPDGLEFHGHCSFIKGGIAFADAVTTVSPTYAEQICTPELGYGLEGLLSHRAERLFGVINGIDVDLWNPAKDPSIAIKYDADHLALKIGNKRALQNHFGLPQRDDVLAFGHIGRLVEQKGVDLIIALLPWLLEQQRVQLFVLGSGNPDFERVLQDAARRHPKHLGVVIGYDEPLAHRIEAGSDCFLMPSRFEPCGLNQMYSQHYGTIPIVHRTGGLADTVVDATTEALLEGEATGFVFDHPTVDGLKWAVNRAIEFRRRPAVWWEKMQRAGMRQDFSWQNSASRYRDLYGFALDHPALSPVAAATPGV